MAQPRNIIFIIADSLRYDSVHCHEERGLPYTEGCATTFSQMRSSGCWTLPATASMFTGLLPHEHGATTQTRAMRTDVPTLAEHLRDAGYRTLQITANPATTHIFGLDRGFDQIHRVWNLVPRRHNFSDTILSVLARPRVRRKVFRETEDFVAGRLAEDVNAARSWMQSNLELQFDMARRALADINGRGENAFLFINLMESHFPYHVADTFEPSRDGIIWRMQEILALYHLCNQSRLVTDREFISPPMLLALRERQRRAWARIAPKIDAFIQEVHQEQDNLVLFGSDHGDNFGEQGWEYHFSNVNDAGTRVLFHTLAPGQETPRTIDRPVSARDVYGTILGQAGIQPGPRKPVDLVTTPHRSLPAQESYWYNKDNKTLPAYRFNQFAFIEGDTKYVRRNEQWLRSSIANGQPESTFETLSADVSPVDEVEMPKTRRAALRDEYAAYERFSQKVGTGK